MIGDGYILQVAHESQNALMVGLNNYLFARFQAVGRAQIPEEMVTAVMLSLLGWPAGDLLPEGFLEAHKDRIEVEAVALAKDERLCEVLSGAVYNMGYGHYVKAGGGRLVNRYVGFMRADRRKFGSTSDMDVWANLGSKLDQMDASILRSYRALQRFKLWRARDENPNERAYYSAISSFAKETEEQKTRIQREQTAAARPARNQQTKKSSKPGDGFPTDSQIKELWDAREDPAKLEEILRRRADEKT